MTISQLDQGPEWKSTLSNQMKRGKTQVCNKFQVSRKQPNCDKSARRNKSLEINMKKQFPFIAL